MKIDYITWALVVVVALCGFWLGHVVGSAQAQAQYYEMGLEKMEALVTPWCELLQEYQQAVHMKQILLDQMGIAELEKMPNRPEVPDDSERPRAGS